MKSFLLDGGVDRESNTKYHTKEKPKTLTTKTSTHIESRKKTTFNKEVTALSQSLINQWYYIMIVTKKIIKNKICKQNKRADKQYNDKLIQIWISS